MLRVLNPNSRKIAPIFGKKKARDKTETHTHTHTHVTPGRLAQTHPRDGDDFNRLRSQSHPRRHQRKRRIAFGGRVWYFVAEFVDTGKKKRCLEFGHKSYPRALVETRNRALSSSSSSLSSSRVSAILSFFFRARMSFFIGTNKSSHADLSLFVCLLCVYTRVTDVRFARGERGLRGVLRVFRRAVSLGHGFRLFAFSQSQKTRGRTFSRFDGRGQSRDVRLPARVRGVWRDWVAKSRRV
jgi:hypothetical protein